MIKFLLFLICFYLGLIILLYLNQRYFIYFPSSFSPSPEESGVSEMEIVTLKTDDGLNLKAWYRPSIDSKHATLIYFHGNAGHIGLRGRIVQPFLKEGYGVLLVTYRGYSGNPGQPHEEGLYQDGRAALEFLHHQNIQDSCIILYGESLGTGVAIQMATEYRIGALILQSPFPSLGDIGQLHYPIFPVKWLIKDSFNSKKKVKKIHVPTLILYAKKDAIIPSYLSIELFEEMPSPKEIQSIPNIGHNDLFKANFAIDFIKKYVKCPKKENLP